ncbi:MAG: nuclear transport factor 2 family protein [Moraxellaceae bacterium]
MSTQIKNPQSIGYQIMDHQAASECSGQPESLVRWYETLTLESLKYIDLFYTQDAWFKDPFNEVNSRAHIAAIFQHMFATLDAPRFVIKQSIRTANETFIVWDMEFSLNGKAMSIKGCSHLRHNEAGLVSHHRDYWDAAEELYEKLPVLGWLMKIIKRKLKTPLNAITPTAITPTDFKKGAHDERATS